MRHGLLTILVLAISLTGCAHEVQMVMIHPNCPEIPATTFKTAGLDAKAGSVKFGQMVTAETSIKLDPQIISGISQSVRDDQTTDALICASRERGELKTEEQVDHAWKKARFHRTDRTADEVIRFYKENPFPTTQRSTSELELKEIQAIKDTFIGGDSFAYVVFTSQFGVPRLLLFHEGKYPLYGVSARISDLDKTKGRKYTLSDLENEIKFNFGELAPHNSRILMEMPIPNDSLRWNIFFGARNGFFTELLRMRRIDNKWKTALKIVKEGKTLLEKIDPDYPVGENGQVEWK